MTIIRISAKALGEIGLDDFCPRCFWIKNKMKLPWQIFPGIFSSIDAFTKKTVHHIFDVLGAPPVWLPEIKEAIGYLPTLHWTKFQRIDEKTGLVISGMEDDVFDFGKKGRMVADYKTAKYTKNQDKLRPMYDVQLNFYGWIEEGFGHTVIPEFPLIYCEPVTEPNMRNYVDVGFSLPFAVKTVMIKKDGELIREMLDRAADILFNSMPDSATGCKNCDLLEQIIFEKGRMENVCN